MHDARQVSDLFTLIGFARWQAPVLSRPGNIPFTVAISESDSGGVGRVPMAQHGRFVVVVGGFARRF
jgi:hypothetical protein